MKKSFVSNSSGAALMLVLWVMVLLMAIVTEFARTMRTEVNITRNFKEETESYYAALAGIEKAKAEILSAGDATYLDEEGRLILGDEEPTREGTLGDVAYSYTITDEERKLNLNLATPDQLGYIFWHSGAEGEELDTIVDSVLDWKDADDLHRLNGAEEDYYQSLERPYSSKDGPFDNVEDLLKVKGIVPDMIYASNEESDYSNIAGYLTTKSTGMVNINTSDRVVLEARFGSAAAENIIALRSTGPILVPLEGGTVKSTYFTITATGTSGGIKRTIKAVVARKEWSDIETLYWNDNWLEGNIPGIKI